MYAMRNASKILMRNSEGKIPLQWFTHTCGASIKTAFKEIWCEEVDWTVSS
jgi:hypothetical protein